MTKSREKKIRDLIGQFLNLLNIAGINPFLVNYILTLQKIYIYNKNKKSP